MGNVKATFKRVAFFYQSSQSHTAVTHKFSLHSLYTIPKSPRNKSGQALKWTLD
jgi:hypothetical protein